MSLPDETETKGSPSGQLLYMPALSDRRPADQVVIWPEERLETVLQALRPHATGRLIAKASSTCMVLAQPLAPRPGAVLNE